MSYILSWQNWINFCESLRKPTYDQFQAFNWSQNKPWWNLQIVPSARLSLSVFVPLFSHGVEYYNLVKAAFWFRLRLTRLSKVESRSGRTKPITVPGNKHCDWFILPILLPTPTCRAFSRDTASAMLVSQTFPVGILFSLDRQKRSREIMEMFWFFQIRFCRPYDSSCDSFFFIIFTRS